MTELISGLSREIGIFLEPPHKKPLVKLGISFPE
jgi:hypothetical protein